MDNNIKEIQDLYKKEEVKKEEDKRRIKDKEVILVKPYEVATSTTTSSEISFIQDEVNNLEQYMKFVYSSLQTRLFKPPLYYTSLQSKGEQDSDFWNEVVIVFIEKKHNIETS